MKPDRKLELMRTLFNPTTIAIMGATDNILKIGGIVTFNTRGGGFTKNVYAINPNPKYRNKKIFGIDVYPSLDKCPEQIDLVCIVVPPDAVIDSMQSAAECDIKTAVIVTAGFNEVKSAERQSANKELVKIADKSGMIFVGPNSLGIYSSENENSPLQLGMSLVTPRPGNVAIISQSGSMGNLLSYDLKKVRYMVSSGNEASLILEDYFEYFANDDKSKIIALFVEGLRDPPRFKRICSEITPKKPIILFKGGTTQSGARAAFSHTASISGSMEIYESLFKQTGVINATDMNQFLYLVKGGLFLLPLPCHDPLRIGIITAGGGLAVHLSDLCEKAGLEVVDLNKEPNGPDLIEEMSEHLPFFWSKNNPIDIIAQSDFNLIPKMMKIILKYDCFDVLFAQSAVLYTELLQSIQPRDEFGQKIRTLFDSTVKDMVKGVSKKEIRLSNRNPHIKIIYFIPITSTNTPLLESYDENKILFFPGDLELATTILKKLHDYQKYIDSANQRT